MRLRRMRAPLVALAALLLVAGAAVALPGLAGRVDRSPRGDAVPVDPPAGSRPASAALAVWAAGGLPEGWARAAAALPAVEAAAPVGSGTVWLDAWQDADGPPRHPPAGLAVPMEVAAIDPSEYLRFVPPPVRGTFEALERDEALLGRSGAALREVGPGGRLIVEGTPVRVAAVVGDAIIGGHELLVRTETGTRMGIRGTRYVLVVPRPETSRERLEWEIRTILPTGARAGIRWSDEVQVLRHASAVLPLARVKAEFGEFAAAPEAGGAIRVSPAWEAANIVRARLPVLGVVECHRRIVPQLREALEEIVARGLDRHIEPGQYAGCYVPRFIGRSSDAGLSRHSWGIAFDINVSTNQLGARPQLDERVVEVFERWGFTWGGRWLVPDGMHFEFVSFP